jgi:plastocyanin
MSLRIFFLILFLLLTSVQVIAHSQLDFVPIEEEDHFHISNDLLLGVILALSLVLIILYYAPKKKTNRINFIRLVLIGLIITSTIALFFVTEELEKSGEFFQANGNIIEVDMKSFNFDYDPNVIEVLAGDTVKLHIENLDFTHTFTVYELGVNEILYPVTNETIEFVAFQRGEFPIFCAIEGHRISGMEGKIIVK